MQNSLVIELDEGDALLNARMDVASVLQPLYDQTPRDSHVQGGRSRSSSGDRCGRGNSKSIVVCGETIWTSASLGGIASTSHGTSRRARGRAQSE